MGSIKTKDSEWPWLHYLFLLLVGWMLVRGLNSAASCHCRYVDASLNIKQRKLLKLLNQSNAASIPYEVKTESHSNWQQLSVKQLLMAKRECNWLAAPKNTKLATAETNWKTTPLVTVCWVQSSVEIQNNAGSSNLTASWCSCEFSM